MPDPRPCRACGSPLDPGGSFCAACGRRFGISGKEVSAIRSRARGRRERDEDHRRVVAGRGWIMAVACLLTVGGLIQYSAQKSDLSKQIASVDQTLKDSTAEERESFQQSFRAETGLRWDEAVRRAQGELQMILVTSIGLAVLYVGLWWWAQRDAFPAALIALLVYLTLQTVNLIVEPESVFRGIILKFFIVAGLGAAVTASYRQRAAEGRSARPRRRLPGRRPVTALARRSRLPR